MTPTPTCACHGWVTLTCPIHGFTARANAIPAPATATPERDALFLGDGELRAKLSATQRAMVLHRQKLADCENSLGRVEIERSNAMALVSELREALKGANADKARLHKLVQKIATIHRFGGAGEAYSILGTVTADCRAALNAEHSTLSEKL